MQAVDLQGTLNKYFFDAERKIPPAHLKTVCKFKHGQETCRYISLSVGGFACMKKTPVKNTLDERVKNNLMKAQGDNCEGLGNISSQLPTAS